MVLSNGAALRHASAEHLANLALWLGRWTAPRKRRSPAAGRLGSAVVRRIIITSYHEVSDSVADELHETIRREGSLDPLLRFMQEHQPETIGFSSGGIRPAPPEQSAT